MFKSKNGNEILNITYRDLRDDEINKLTLIYERNNCNLSATRRDKECWIKGYAQLNYYKKKYNFDSIVIQIRKKLINDYIKHSTDILMKGKLKAIGKALELLEDRIFERVSLITGETYKLSVPPSCKDIEVAYKILKIELNEPLNILDNKGSDELLENLKKIQIEIIKPKELNEGKPKDTSDKSSGGNERKPDKDNSK